eukprot:TRINITY_DN7765_c0_g1_i2.p1 TRINITY_DN7765_c0_g1~~TRINITY_DN7765_c0_g1_i2.p1  ORF type:complete len:438 (-),score=97.52 TRINITY_DN7765_c0_g1_i2:78-1391(-)
MPCPTVPASQPVEDPTPNELVIVSSYTRFDNLAHGPRGTESKYGMYTFRLEPSTGELVLMSVDKEPVMNPAFSRYCPKTNVLHACTESVAENGKIVSWSVDCSSGRLKRLNEIDAGGTSTCYITLDKELSNMLVVNYWDASLKVMRMDEKGIPRSIVGSFEPNAGRTMAARHDKHVNHSRNDADAQRERQADPHSHALILDPFFGKVAFVPDLGKDVIWEFLFDAKEGALKRVASCPSGDVSRPGVALGPRYIEFHPRLPVCYVINELSCEVSVFEFDREVAQKRLEGEAVEGSSLRLVQKILTVPEAFPTDMNTCGRICVHNSGRFVLAANRGHDSIAVFSVDQDTGRLELADIQHTRGKTPRHFKFDHSGQWLIAANQDSDNIGVFHFNIATGKLKWTGNSYAVASPNFVECVLPRSSNKAQGHVEARAKRARIS